jgi:hypothetical protein
VPDDARPARVAVVGPFSGPRAAWGRRLRDAAAHKAHPWLRRDFHDDQGDGATGEAAPAAIAATVLGSVVSKLVWPEYAYSGHTDHRALLFG